MPIPGDSPQSGAGPAPIPAIALTAGARVPWRLLMAAALLAAVLGVVVTGVLAKRHSAVAPAVPHRGLSSLPLAAQGQISAALGADQSAYRVTSTAGGFAAFNPGQRLYARFGRSGVTISSGATTFGLSLRAVGYGRALTPVGAVAPSANANRVIYTRSGITEWYANGPLGIEQGFTIPRPLSARPAGPLTLSMSLSGNSRIALTHGGQSLILSHTGGSSLRYGKLTVTDANGRTLHAWLATRGRRPLVNVNTRGARYPLRIDPFVQQGERLQSPGPPAFALSSDGNTAVFPDARVFTRSGAIWTQQATLQCRDQNGACGGFSLALSADGNTALIGDARYLSGTGAAWVFVRSGSKWSLGKKLTGRREAGNAGFGSSVALSSDGSTALIGGPNDFVRGERSVGAAWVFIRAKTTWVPQGSKLEGHRWGRNGRNAGGRRNGLRSQCRALERRQHRADQRPLRQQRSGGSVGVYSLRIDMDATRRKADRRR